MEKIISSFNFEGELQGFEPWGCGHINQTYSVYFKDREGKERRYILQCVNHDVFKDIEGLMENVKNVTCYLREKIKECGGDPDRETLNLIQTRDGQNFINTEDGYYRAYLFVENACSYEYAETPEIFCSSGEAFGKFQQLLSEYPADTLHETIPDFHHTAKRYDTFLDAVSRDAMGRAAEARPEIDFIKARREDTRVLVDLIEQGRLPLRVSHNDTKLNNVMFDARTNEGICVVDLDTVMPGLALYDFGDGIRFGANKAAEDEPDLSKVGIDLVLFEAYTKGYLSQCGKSLTKEELRHLAFSAKLMTLECGMRFLTDYLNGDVYFKTDYPRHNLVRARNQLRLVEDMERHMEDMDKIVEKYRSPRD